MKDKLNITPAAVAALAKGDVENFKVASTPGGIEAQEAAGQVIFVNSETLPKEMLGCNRKQLEDMGIVFGSDADDLFVNVTLPKGWKKQATEHSMHSDLLDDKGRKRAGIFYKAAFYDRNAHMRLDQRYTVDSYISCDEHGTKIVESIRHNQPTHYATAVMDVNNELHRIGIRDSGYSKENYELNDVHDKQARAWLDENYPEWQNPLAYWD